LEKKLDRLGGHCDAPPRTDRPFKSDHR
jgi:hypothetical protein